MCMSVRLAHVQKYHVERNNAPSPDQTATNLIRATIKYVRAWAVGKLKSEHKHWLITIRFFVYKHCIICMA